jgi:hypothetical protein
METSPTSRRDFLKRLSAVSVIGLGASSVLSACGGGESASNTEAAPEAAAAPAGCMDTTGLTEQEIAMRNQLQYVDVTANPEQACHNCALYLAAADGAACGGCNLLKGPIAPDGYCISWAAAQM